MEAQISARTLPIEFDDDVAICEFGALRVERRKTKVSTQAGVEGIRNTDQCVLRLRSLDCFPRGFLPGRSRPILA